MAEGPDIPPLVYISNDYIPGQENHEKQVKYQKDIFDNRKQLAKSTARMWRMPSVSNGRRLWVLCSMFGKCSHTRGSSLKFSVFQEEFLVCTYYCWPRSRGDNIVACHLSKGSQFRWREDMSGGLTNVDIPRYGWSLQPVRKYAQDFLSGAASLRTPISAAWGHVEGFKKYHALTICYLIVLRVGRDNMFGSVLLFVCVEDALTQQSI